VPNPISNRRYSIDEITMGFLWVKLRLPQVVKRTFESNLKNVPVNGNLWVLFLWIVLPLIQFHAWSGVLTRGYAVLITKYWKNRFQIEDNVIFLLGNQEVT